MSANANLALLRQRIVLITCNQCFGLPIRKKDHLQLDARNGQLRVLRQKKNNYASSSADLKTLMLGTKNLADGAEQCFESLNFIPSYSNPEMDLSEGRY